MVYKWYILPIGWLYTTYHPLQEPEKSIESYQLPSQKQVTTNLHKFFSQLLWKHTKGENFPKLRTTTNLPMGFATLPETNIFAPKNGWLEYKPFLLGWHIFRGELLVSGRVVSGYSKPPHLFQLWSSAIWKGSHNPILRGRKLTMVINHVS